jgi:hypothetical protein
MGPLLAVMAWAPCSRAARMWVTAGSPSFRFRDVASNRTSAWALASHSRTWLAAALLGRTSEAASGFSRAGAPSASLRAGPRPHRAVGSRPAGSAIHPRRREAIPVMWYAMPWRLRSSCARSSRRRTRVRLTLPKPRKQRLWVRMGISSTASCCRVRAQDGLATAGVTPALRSAGRRRYGALTIPSPWCVRA